MGRVLADTPTRWPDLTRRVMSAAVLLPLALFCVWSGGWWFLGLTLIAVAGMASEWAAFCGVPFLGWPGVALPLVLMAVTIAGAARETGLAIGGMLAGMLVLGYLSRTLQSGRAFMLGLPYIGLGAASLPWLRADSAGLGNTLFVLVVIWSSDIGAYMTGRLIGGPKLAPAISPGKTISGAIGGLIAASLGGTCVAAAVSAGGLAGGRVIVLSALLGIAAQAGDLLESGLKRHFGVKDSGTLIPGHGGLLDRLDAVLAVAPVAVVLAMWAGAGGFIWR